MKDWSCLPVVQSTAEVYSVDDVSASSKHKAMKLLRGGRPVNRSVVHGMVRQSHYDGLAVTSPTGLRTSSPRTATPLAGLLDNSRIRHLVDWTTRGLDISRTGQLADQTTRGPDNSRTGQVADWTARGCHRRLCMLSFRSFGCICETASCPVRELTSAQVV